MYPKVAVPRTPRIINIPSSFVPWQLEKYLIRSPGMNVKLEDERITGPLGAIPNRATVPVQRPEFKNSKNYIGVLPSAAWTNSESGL